MNVKDSLARARKQAKGGQRGTCLKASSSNSASTSTVSPLFRADKTLDALYENMEVLTGQRGEGAAVVMVTDSSGNRVPFYPDGSGGTTDGSGSDSGSDGDGGLTPAYPSKPTGLVVNGGFSVVELDWDAPVYYGHSLTQIWRCPEDNLSEAVQVGSTAANIYSDPIDPVYEGYYWIRFVNSDSVAGPYNASEGTYVKTQESTDDIINVINDTINDSPLIAQLQAGLDGVQEQITTIDSEGTQAFQNMWSVKASADGITAGIGLVAGVDDEGEPVSQVAVAATQFFVFDPNNPNPDGTMEALFYVDADYGVCMQKAVIEQATIQVLNAQTIVADEVTAGIEIDSPDIKGGQIEIANGFSVDSCGNMTANNATLNDVTLNRVTANEGQFNNVTISEDCVIEGTLSANQIKGDIVNAVGFSIGISGSRRIEIIDDQEFDRTVMIPAVSMNCESHDHEEYDHTVSGGASIQMEISINGTAYATYSASCSGSSSGAGSASLAYDFIMGTGDLIIDITVTNSTYYGSVSISDVVLMVAKKGSGGIIVS